MLSSTSSSSSSLRRRTHFWSTMSAIAAVPPLPLCANVPPAPGGRAPFQPLSLRVDAPRDHALAVFLTKPPPAVFLTSRPSLAPLPPPPSCDALVLQALLLGISFLPLLADVLTTMPLHVHAPQLLL